MRLVALVAVLLLSGAARAAAHPAPFSYLDVRLEDRVLHVGVVVHVLDVAHELGVPEAQLIEAGTLAPHGARIVSLIRGRLQIEADGSRLPYSGDRAAWTDPVPVPDRHAVRLDVRYEVGRPGVIRIAAVMFPYDPQHQTFVNVYERGTLALQGILDRQRDSLEHFTGTRQGTLAVVRKFLPSGVHHILIGPDHLLFLVGLLLLGGSLKRLALVVTAFTLAHSVTLSLAALNLVVPPPWIVEPAIALSIVYVGADNLTVRGGRDVRAWIAFAFGLIHGFGFANVLREMDLPARALGWSLFSFNLGVEVGQLLVVLAVASAIAAIRARSEAAGRRLVVVGSVGVMAAGAFWFVERVFFSGGAA